MNYLKLLFFISLISIANSQDLVGLNDDVFGLIVFKTTVKDPNSHLNTWNEDDTSPCSWQYIQCNPISSRVTKISLHSLGLSGKIGRGLEKLQNLKELDLSNNNFTGEISSDLSLIPTLERVNLSRNGLSGRIQISLTKADSMKFLDLSENSFSGPLQDNAFDKCLSLRYLSISGNFLEGPIPSSISKCTSLSYLNLSNNRFSGNFEKGIWNLSRLRTLDLSDNAFSGFIPLGISFIHNLKELNMRGNCFSGSLPADTGLCPHLNIINFSENLFTGELPQSFKFLNSLNFLNLSRNMLTGDFPEWIGNLSSLKTLDLSSNGFTGYLHSSIGNLKSLSFLSLASNNLSGEIPSSLGFCTQLSITRLRGNTFTGSIPKELFDLSLNEIDLSNNELSGFIPSGSSKLFESLQVFDLSANKLTGDIPPELGLFSSLMYLNLSRNNLQSRVPTEFGYFQNLTVLDLRNNELFGLIPNDICDSGSLQVLQLDGNFMSGPIPEGVGNCSSLSLLSLSHNNLSGSIPRSISMLKRLKILKLEFNELFGEIPQELGTLENLLAVNISYNKLTGRLPFGSTFQNLDESALRGNLGICSPLLKGPCKMNVPKPLVLNPYAYGDQIGGRRHRGDYSNDSENMRRPRFFSVTSIIAIAAAIVIALGVLVITLLNITTRKRHEFVENSLESMCSGSSRSGGLATGRLVWFDSKVKIHLVTSPELLLSKALEIGEGVFGTVFKASIGGEGRAFAIKKLQTSNILQYPEDFIREVRVLAKAKHPNLITLKGYFWSPHLQLLVSDFASNESLQEKLHEPTNQGKLLSWPTRFKIIMGIAKGISHLHHSCIPPIIHYNIKPSNILLDENFNPKVSDFGLARLLTKLDKHVMSSRFQSALGYVAPELACQNLRVNEKCDVYGFGALILEIVTGKKPVEYGEDNVVILNDHVRVLLEEGNALECVDLRMGEYPEDEVLPVLKLGLVCTSQIPSNRPSMAEVVQILEVIKSPSYHRMESF